MTLWLFAFGAGMLATVNPCGFAMLPAFIAYYLGDEDNSAGQVSLAARLGQGLAVGAAVSAGFAGTFTAAGLLVAFGLRSLVGAVPWAAVVIGVLLVALGLVMLTGRQLKLTLRRNLGPGQGRGYRRMIAFGAGYAVASLSCTLAVLLAVVAQATATANPLQLIAVFLAYALGASTVLVGLTVTAALAKATVARGIRRLLPYATRLGGVVLTLSGSYLVLYWLPSLTGDRRRPSALSGTSDSVSSTAMAFLDGHQAGVAAVAVALAAAAAMTVLVGRHRSAASGSHDRRAPADPASAPGTEHTLSPGADDGPHGGCCAELPVSSRGLGGR